MRAAGFQLTINRYTPYYCEENIWHLCQEPQFASVEAKVLFVSNPLRQCYFWYQRSAPTGEAVCWDYHVILLAKDSRWKIWDLDTTLPLPMDALGYLERTFMHVGKAQPTWDPIFRVIDAKEFTAEFASDRSHMLDDRRQWLQPPPAWECIGPGKVNNLQSFIDMSDTRFGVVMNFDQLREICAR
jgi:hypothetical protein